MCAAQPPPPRQQPPYRAREWAAALVGQGVPWKARSEMAHLTTSIGVTLAAKQQAKLVVAKSHVLMLLVDGEYAAESIWNFPIRLNTRLSALALYNFPD